MSQASRRVRFGVVGFGFGEHHVRTLTNMADAELVAVADDRRPEELRQAGERYRFRPYASASEMVEREDLDAVTVCVPPAARRKVLRAGLDAGLAMFVEKPWATNSAHARELAAMCRESARPVMPAFSFRFHPAIVRLGELLGDDLGRPRMLHGRYVFGWLPPAGHWAWDPEDGNGFLNENSCHLFDAVCSLIGRPARVFAAGGRFTGRPAEDAATVVLSFESGAIASLACGGIGAAAFCDFPRIDLWAENGQASLIGRDHVWQELRWATTDDAEVRRLSVAPEQLGRTRYTHALQRFVEVVRTGGEPPATLDEAVLSVDVAMAVVESARTGRCVEVPVQ
jgi:predicted dehydrogenase